MRNDAQASTPQAVNLYDVAQAGRERLCTHVCDVGSASLANVTIPEPAPRFDRVAPGPRLRAGPSLVAGEPTLLQRCVAESTHLCFVAAAPDGRVRAVNVAFAVRSGYSPRALSERDIWSLLTEADATHLRRCALHGWMPAPEPLLLTFVDAAGAPFTLRCLVDLDPDGLIVVGEPPQAAWAPLPPQ